MINFNQQQFMKTLANMGFEVFDNSTEAVDSQSAYCDTENGTFQITVVDKWVVFHKPNGTTKDYWGSTAQILAYVRQTLKANSGIVEAPEPEAEEVPEANVEGREVASDPEWVSEENVRRIVEEATRDYAGFVRHDLDAIDNGWDAFSYPESGYLYQHCLNVLESGMPSSWPKSGESYDEALEWLADATYSALCLEEEEDDSTPKFADLTPEQEALIEGLGVGPVFVTPDQEEAVDRGLGLRDLDREGMRAVRNSVVRHLAPLATQAREAGDWDLFDQLHANMSGICAVIDLRMAS